MFKGEKLHPAAEADLPVRPDRPADRMLKVNLPPLMGRRDAACDRAAELVAKGFSGNRDELDALRQLARLLDSARADTERIFSILSSPDTITREHRLLAFFTLMSGAVENIRNLLSIGEIFNPKHDAPALALNAARANARWLCAYFAAAAPNLRRYRDYAVKNFSPDYAARYECAYREFAEIYADKQK